MRTGQRLAVEISKDGRLLLTPQIVDPLSICALLPKPRVRGVRLEDIETGIGRHVALQNRRLQARRKPGKRRRRR